MDKYTATELAYKNGYEQGKADAYKVVASEYQKWYTQGLLRGTYADSKWISVKERLPEVDGKYLVFVQHEGRGTVLIGHLILKKFWSVHDVYGDSMGDCVLYWMPLPELPKEAAHD